MAYEGRARYTHKSETTYIIRQRETRVEVEPFDDRRGRAFPCAFHAAGERKSEREGGRRGRARSLLALTNAPSFALIKNSPVLYNREKFAFIRIERRGREGARSPSFDSCATYEM